MFPNSMPRQTRKQTVIEIEKCLYTGHDWSFGGPQNPGQILQSKNKRKWRRRLGPHRTINESATALREDRCYRGKAMRTLSLGKKSEILPCPFHSPGFTLIQPERVEEGQSIEQHIDMIKY